MKLTRFHAPAGSAQDGKIVPAVFVDQTTIADCSVFGEDWNESFFESAGLERLAQFIKDQGDDLPQIDAASVRLAPAIARPSKLICIGLNYAKHAAEAGAKPPREPILFSKATSAWSGPNDPVEIPKGSTKTDWEVELAVVIATRAKCVRVDHAMRHVAGFAVHNDYSERQWQLEHGGQWVKGKSADTFAPFGPYMATVDEIADPNQLRLWLKRNGETIQDSTTADCIFNIQEIVSYISRFMTLLPGDVISTGTPSGVGLGFSPPVYLQPGDVIELGVEGLGTQKQTAIATP